MANDLHNLNDALAELEKISVKTSQGEFVKLEDVRRLAKQQREQAAVEKEAAPSPKSMVEAKEAILKNPELMKQFAAVQAKPQPGRSVPASQDPQSPSRA